MDRDRKNALKEKEESAKRFAETVIRCSGCKKIYTIDNRFCTYCGKKNPCMN